MVVGAPYGEVAPHQEARAVTVFCPHATPTAPCADCPTCVVYREETDAERAERIAFTATGRQMDFTLVPDLKGKSLVEWMKNTDLVNGKAVRVRGARQ